MPYRWSDYTPTFASGSPLLGRDGVLSNYLGGDGGFECAIDGERSFWTFGDTYRTTTSPGRRHGG